MKKLLCFCLVLCAAFVVQAQDIIVGAAATAEYFPDLKNKKVAVVANNTAMVGNQHLVDFLIQNKFNVVCIFAPEHGFRGTADAGEHVSSSVDAKTGIPIRSLYDGDLSRPSKESMESFDVLIFDIQDVGLRFYTYYVTMVKLMDACADFNKRMIILDRPNPNGHYVDGPILNLKYKSGVGWLPIPVVHGLTLGELAKMCNGERWLPDGKQCNIQVVKCKNYTHKSMYQLPIPPSPNLANMKAVYLFPSLCYFEATPVSLGRGTSIPFQIYGHPNMKGYDYSFTPKSVPGAKNPPQLNNKCYGVDLSAKPNDEILSKGLDLTYLIDAYNNLNMGDHFFSPFFEKLIGVSYVRTMIKEGKSAEEIKKMWADDVSKFKLQRKPYLLYAE